jgi:hypothetical protein
MLFSDSELRIVGEYGLRNKREVWRVMLTLSKIRRAARYTSLHSKTIYVVPLIMDVVNFLPSTRKNQSVYSKAMP